MGQGTCSIEGCEKAARARGWCRAHYARWYRFGDPLPKRRICSVHGCDRKHFSLGFCQGHYNRAREGRSTDAPIGRYEVRGAECDVEGCLESVHARQWCRTHYQRWRDNGDPTIIKLRKPPPHYTGTDHPLWAGENVGYAGAHIRLRTMLGRADLYECVDCGGQAQHWSYDNADPDERPSRQGAYSVKGSQHYDPRCVSCHVRFDYWARQGVLGSHQA